MRLCVSFPCCIEKNDRQKLNESDQERESSLNFCCACPKRGFLRHVWCILFLLSLLFFKFAFLTLSFFSWLWDEMRCDVVISSTETLSMFLMTVMTIWWWLLWWDDVFFKDFSFLFCLSWWWLFKMRTHWMEDAMEIWNYLILSSLFLCYEDFFCVPLRFW